ncbi:hypothetical protein CO674_30950 [Rhizobium hidalgonense]|uniref:Uncharacterized protein n=1 Tax=Rhizobium hidalgonense TaxID=1538159 RepID=A0ABX4JI83_9HYPH|nr:hypothetical protein CO674_30950 [Rhizobium hidalgonense]PON05649.1 hypothetical protein ATY29_20355 [Rhizobium hidalgonense]
MGTNGNDRGEAMPDEVSLQAASSLAKKPTPLSVIPGLEPRIHALAAGGRRVDARVKPAVARFVPMAAPHPNPLPVLTGRGDVPSEMSSRSGEGAASSLLPVNTGRRWRQPDEGPASPISCLAKALPPMDGATW